MGVQILRSFDALHEYVHERYGIECVLDACSQEFRRRDGCLYRPGIAIAKVGLLDAWNEFYAHEKKMRRVVEEEDLLFEEKLRFAKGVVFHGSKVNMRTAGKLRGRSVEKDRDLFLEYFFLTGYVLEVAKGWHEILEEVSRENRVQLERKRAGLAEKVDEYMEGGKIRFYLGIEKKFPVLSRAIEGSQVMSGLRDVEAKAGVLEAVLSSDAVQVSEALQYVKNAQYRLSDELGLVTNQLSYSSSNLSRVLKEYLIDSALGLVAGESLVPPSLATSCRMGSIICEDEVRKEELLRRGLMIRKTSGNGNWEDNLEKAYFYIHLTSSHFLNRGVFESKNWDFFLDNLDTAIVRMYRVHDVLKGSRKFLHHVLHEAYEFFKEVGPERSYYLSRFAKASIAQVDEIIFRHHDALDRMLIPLDRFPK